MTFKFQLKGKLHESINDLKFMLAILDNDLTFFMDEHEMKMEQLSNSPDLNILQFKELLTFLIKWKEITDNSGITEQINWCWHR
jgi:hypothetical protein